MYDELKTAVYEANIALDRAGLVLLTWGNVSGRDRASGLIGIKPSGVSYDALRPADIVLVDPETGKVVDSGLRPSSDTPTHLALYRAFPGVAGIAHSHSTHAVAWAQARQPLPCFGTTHADHFRGAIPVTAEMSDEMIAGEYEAETGTVIIDAFAGIPPLDIPGVLVAGHGPFTWGPSPEKAVENSIVLEEVARMGLLALQISAQAVPIGDALRDRHFLRKHGAGAYYGQGKPPATGQG
jgi:L-ribulose-5-phosphate 4-epimerase